MSDSIALTPWLPPIHSRGYSSVVWALGTFNADETRLLQRVLFSAGFHCVSCVRACVVLIEVNANDDRTETSAGYS